MKSKYLFLLFIFVLSACNISEEDADNFYKQAIENKRQPYLALQYFDRASAHEKYRVYGVAIQMFDIGCYLWQRSDQLDVNKEYLEEAIIKSVEIFYELSLNEKEAKDIRYKATQNLILILDNGISNYHKIAKELIEKNDAKLLENIKSFVETEVVFNNQNKAE
ncbi:MAG: hypothetical protein K8F60_05140 [Melioribacteraceae bacterium]|nr:hypothetical protein [Melioribacteraceae bacterium]